MIKYGMLIKSHQTSQKMKFLSEELQSNHGADLQLNVVSSNIFLREMRIFLEWILLRLKWIIPDKQELQNYLLMEQA